VAIRWFLYDNRNFVGVFWFARHIKQSTINLTGRGACKAWQLPFGQTQGGTVIVLNGLFSPFVASLSKYTQAPSVGSGRAIFEMLTF
jgi:hypothetical protein